MTKIFMWMSFDLGVQGDYQGMYAWLDNHKAKECGDSLACLWYNFSDDLVADIQKDLLSSVTLDPKKHRVYIVRSVNGKPTGTFVIGSRRSAPWTGFGATGEQGDDA